MTRHVVLVGMSIADVHHRDLLAAVARRRGAALAFLQMGDPALTVELDRLTDAGATHLTLVGVSTGPLAPGRSWLSRVAAYWWRERGSGRPVVEVATRLWTGPATGASTAPHAALDTDELDRLLADTRPITGEEPGLASPAWEHVGGHRRQVLVCRGPRCSARGAVDSLRAMVLATMEHGLGDDDVLLVHTGCQSPCNQAPVVSVQPDDVWYGHVDPETAVAIVAEHLAGGEPIEKHRLPRRTPLARDGEIR